MQIVKDCDCFAFRWASFSVCDPSPGHHVWTATVHDPWTARLRCSKLAGSFSPRGEITRKSRCLGPHVHVHVEFFGCDDLRGSYGDGSGRWQNSGTLRENQKWPSWTCRGYRSVCCSMGKHATHRLNSIFLYTCIHQQISQIPPYHQVPKCMTHHHLPRISHSQRLPILLLLCAQATLLGGTF